MSVTRHRQGPADSLAQCGRSCGGADPARESGRRVHAGAALLLVFMFMVTTSHQLGPQLQPSLVWLITLAAPQKVSDAEAIRLIGLGTWRLRGHMGPLFEGLAAQIEGAWRHKVPGLGLGPLPRVRWHPHTSHAAVQPVLLQQKLWPQHALVLSRHVSRAACQRAADEAAEVNTRHGCCYVLAVP